MPRSSRHRSGRSRRHSVDRSDSEEEERTRQRKLRDEEPAATSGARVSRDLDAEKRWSSRSVEEKDGSGVGNGELSDERGKKRKERVEEFVVGDRWVSGEDRKSKLENSGRVQMDKSEKLKSLQSESKHRSSRRHESSGEVTEDVVVKLDRRSEKLENDSVAQLKHSKESYKERESEMNREREGTGIGDRFSKERERECRSEREREETNCERRSLNYDKKVQHASHENVEDILNKNEGSKLVDYEDDTESRKDAKSHEMCAEDLMPDLEMERGLEKHTRKQRESEDKQLGDVRDKDDKRASAKGDNRIRTYGDERYEDVKSRDHVDNLDRDKRQRGNRSHDEHYRDRSSGRSDRRYSRNENSLVDGHYKKSNIHDIDHYGSFADDRDARHKESRGKKRSFEDNDDLTDLRSRSGRELREETEKVVISNMKSESRTNYLRSDHRHSNKRDNMPWNSHWKASSTSSVNAAKENSRDASKLAEIVNTESSEERVISHTLQTASGGRTTTAVVHERVTGTWQEKIKSTNDGDLGDVYPETAASSKYERAPKSDSCSSPGWLEEKSPSKNVHRISDRTGTRHSLDAEGEKSSSKDGVRGKLIMEKTIASEVVKSEIYNREKTPIGSAFNRTVRSYGASPGRLPPSSVRRGKENPSTLGLFEGESDVQVGDRRSYNHNKRGGDQSFGWGQGNAWKGSGPSWPPPGTNGFIPLPRGPPAAFNPVMPYFPPPFFGVRPSMDLSANGVPFHVPDIGGNFSSHGRHFGWNNTVDQTYPPPHMQGWDGNNGTFRDESHIYGRPDWEANRHLMGSRDWGSGNDVWKTQNKESELHPRTAADEGLVELPRNNSVHELALLEAIESKVSCDPPVASKETEAILQKKFLGSSKSSGNLDVNFSAYYLSKIDISPELADIELYKKCISVCATSDSSNGASFVAHESIKNVDNKSKLKSGSKSPQMGLPFPTAKDAIIEKAMALYSKQNEKFSYKPKAYSEISSVDKKMFPEDLTNAKTRAGDDRETVQGGGKQATLPLASSNSIEAKSISCDTIANNTTAMEHELCSNSEGVISSSDFQANEVFMENCSASVNRIHHFPENTH